MNLKFKLFGSILMILGTCVGAGMLALPIAAAREYFSFNVLILMLAWLLMTIGAFALLEVNLWMPAKSNLISMANATLGRFGQYATWFVYLLLLYSLLCAYIASSSDVFQTLLQWAHIPIPHWLAVICVVILLGTIVYGGVGAVDFTNRGLMSFKLIAYLLLVAFILPKIHIKHLAMGESNFRFSTFMVMITSFGYAIIIPSLRTYLKSRANLLHRAVIIGSLLPLAIYFLWIFSIQGLIPKTGSHGLIRIEQAGNAIGQLMNFVNYYLHNPWVHNLANAFISVCAVTSFLGVSLCLVDFVTDGLKLHHYNRSPFRVYLITFLPPLAIVLWWPNTFIRALSYAGVFCLILLALLPLLMLYSGRHIKKFSKKNHTWLSHAVILTVIVFVVCLILLAVFYKL
jgi:tyrosine-specific transport protein